MPSFGSERGNVLYLILCAAPPAQQAGECVDTLQAMGWDVCAITTPAAGAWVDGESLAEATGHPVRAEFRGPDDDEFAPRGDAVLVAPATCNTINKCALGINDNLALGLINEALGSPSVPVTLVPWVNGSLNEHLVYRPNLDRLRSAGAHLVVSASSALAFAAACIDAANWARAASRSSG